MQVMDKHLQILAQQHMETKFVKVLLTIHVNVSSCAETRTDSAFRMCFTSSYLASTAEQHRSSVVI